MATPKVSINIQDGGLGRTNAGSDGVALLILPTTEANYADPTILGAFYSFADFQNATNLVDSGDAFGSNHIAEGNVFDFYQEAGNGAKLFVLLYPVDGTGAVTAEEAVLASEDIIRDDLNGEVRLAGVAYETDEADIVNGLHGALYDGTSGVATATKTVASALENDHMPLSFIVEGKAATVQSASIENLREIDNRHLSVVFGTKTGYEAFGAFEEGTDNYYSPVGTVLGRLARIKVNRSAGAVKDGSLNATYLQKGLSGSIGGYLDKGYMTLRSISGLSGFFVADTPTLTDAGSDFAYIEMSRTINKVHRIAYITYVQELLSEIEVDKETGLIDETAVKHFEGLIEQAIETEMISNQELSGTTVYIDPEQNILATNKLIINLKVIPTGVLREIEVNIGFDNPFKY